MRAGGSDGQAVAINLDIEPVEKPETVLWIDPVHRDPAEQVSPRRHLLDKSLREALPEALGDDRKGISMR